MGGGGAAPCPHSPPLDPHMAEQVGLSLTQSKTPKTCCCFFQDETHIKVPISQEMLGD